MERSFLIHFILSLQIKRCIYYNPSHMNIHFTKKDYLLLLDMLFVSDWVMHSHEIPGEPQQNGYKQLRKKLLSHFKEMGVENRIEYSKECSDCWESSESEGNLLEKFIERYDNDVFWRELARRLASPEIIEEIIHKKCHKEPNRKAMTKYFQK